MRGFVLLAFLRLTTTAHLAALALEHGAELCSSDYDFTRFRRLTWRDPLGLKAGH